MNNKKRSTFSGGFGFVLAAAGSAVGLGNIWRFPYLAAKYGGGIFLLFYILLVVTFGFSLMIAENAIGRKTGKSGLCAFRELSKKMGIYRNYRNAYSHDYSTLLQRNRRLGYRICNKICNRQSSAFGTRQFLY